MSGANIDAREKPMAWSRLPRGIALAAVLAMMSGALWLAIARQPDHPLGRREYRRIAHGMTRAEVQAILGKPRRPTGDGLSLVELVDQEGPVNAFGTPEGKPDIWVGSQGQIAVYFDSWDASARVLGKQLYRIRRRM
jgi:hypothetical protein